MASSSASASASSTVEPLLPSNHHQRQQKQSSNGRSRRTSRISSVSSKLKTAAFSIASHRKNISIALGPVLFLILYLCVDIGEEGSRGQSAAMVGSMAWMFLWWVTQAVPLPITALIPLFLFPLLQLETASEVSKSYATDTTFLILGSFILASAVRVHNIHKRFALRMLLWCKKDPRLLLLGFAAGSSFISMWVDNAAACAMLMPMVLVVQQKVHTGFHQFNQNEERQDVNNGTTPSCDDAGLSAPDPHGSEDTTSHNASANTQLAHQEEEEEEAKEEEEEEAAPIRQEPDLSTPLDREMSLRLDKHLSTVLSTHMDFRRALEMELDFCRAAALCVAYGVVIGGMATITGNGANMVFVGLWEVTFPNENVISFLQWMLFATPFAIVLTLIMWIIVVRLYCPSSAIKPVSASLQSLQMEDELAKIGPITSDQVTVLVLFSILIVLWMTKSIGGDSLGWSSLFNDYPGNGSITIFMAVVLFVIPNPRNPKEKLMSWSQCKDIHWNVILLVGGGFALADGISKSGLANVLSTKLSFLASTPYWAITPALAVIIGIMTEFTTNAATASVFLPLVAELASSINVDPLFLMVATTMSSQFSYMLPTGTATNAMAFTIESLEVKHMAKPGIILKLIAIILLSILMPTLGAFVFNTTTPTTSG